MAAGSSLRRGREDGKRRGARLADRPRRLSLPLDRDEGIGERARSLLSGVPSAFSRATPLPR
jgi:hypothetical protein